MVIDFEKSPSATTELLLRAEEWLNALASKARTPRTTHETQQLVQELELHQTDLKRQNAELCQIRNEMEKSLEKYTKLYDSAPVGYFTLDRNGDITAVNLTGANLLGIERTKLLGQHLGELVKEEYRQEFSSFLDMVFTSQGKEECEVALLNKGNISHFVQIEAMHNASGEQCPLALIDITGACKPTVVSMDY
jgi:PAS domain S-box-containing protein